MIFRHCIAILFLTCAAAPRCSPATILQAFWWDCQNERSYALDRNYKYEWYNYIRAQLPRLESAGITGLWTPPPCKAGNSSGESMGYDLFDHYDLGEKPRNQPPSKPDGRTRFGTRDELLRLVSSAHAHGIEVYPDIVLNHMSGGGEDPEAPARDAAGAAQGTRGIGAAQGTRGIGAAQGTRGIGAAQGTRGIGHETGNRWKRFRYPAAGGPEAGRWPKGWWNFHPNPDHDSVNSNDIDSDIWGPDVCYASNHDADGKPSKDYMLKQAGDWFEWLSRVTGVDGYRFDAVRHYEPSVVRDLLAREESARKRKPFAVAEYGTWDSKDLDRWVGEVQGRAATFDFPLHDQLYKMVFARGLYNIGSLPDFLQKDASHSVTFVNSHDTVRGAAGNYRTIPPGDPWAGLAYAFILSLDRTPCVFYEDLFANRSAELRRFGDPLTRPMRGWLVDLIRIRERYAAGSEPVLFPLRTEDLLAIERPGRMVTIINDNGADWKEAAFQTSFGPGVELRDITGQSDARVTTGTGDDAGKIKLWLPQASYVVLVNAGDPPLSPIERASRRTVQEVEFADDLSTGALGDTAREFRIWPVPGSEIRAELTLAGQAEASLDAIAPDGKKCPATDKFDGRRGTWKAASSGWHTFRVRLPGRGPTPGRLRIDYEGE